MHHMSFVPNVDILNAQEGERVPGPSERTS